MDMGPFKATEYIYIYIRESLNLQKKIMNVEKLIILVLQWTVVDHKKMTAIHGQYRNQIAEFFFVSVLVIVCFLHTHTHRHVIHDSDKLPKVHILRECSSALRAILLITDRNKSSQRVAVNIN